MTQAQRNSAILVLLKQQTSKNTATVELARQTLIAEGIYTKSGKLSVNYGGRRKKVPSAA